MEFGVPKRRELSAKKEKYENIAVITISEFKGKGTGRTITLNEKAIVDLGIDFEKEVRISFSFDVINPKVVIANTTGLENVAGVKLAKTSKSSSDKAYFDAIKAHFGVKLEDAVELSLTKDGEFNGFPTMKLALLTATDKMENVIEEAVAEATPKVAPALESINVTADVLDYSAKEEASFDVAPTPVEAVETTSNPFETVNVVPVEVDIIQATEEASNLAIEQQEMQVEETTEEKANDFYKNFEV
jgi:hypothetical protein